MSFINCRYFPDGPSRRRHHRRSREITEDTQLRALLGNDIDVTDNGTLRRRKKHHHRHRESRVVEENGEVVHVTGEGGEKRMKERKSSSSSSSRKHHHRGSSLLLTDGGMLPVTEESLKSFTGTEMERGLLETLMGPSDEGTIKRNKERRRSIKEKRRSMQASHELKRSRTRENAAALPEFEDEGPMGTEV